MNGLRNGILPLLALLALLAGCASSGEESDDFIADFEATLRGTAGYGSVGGSVRAVTSLGETAVTIRLNGAEPGERHPWHVHEGVCGSGGAIVGASTAYGLLEPDASGSDRVVSTIDVQLDDDADYHVNVHASTTDLGTVIACGELVD